MFKRAKTRFDQLIAWPGRRLLHFLSNYISKDDTCIFPGLRDNVDAFEIVEIPGESLDVRLGRTSSQRNRRLYIRAVIQFNDGCDTTYPVQIGRIKIEHYNPVAKDTTFSIHL